jgi:hypothetical protein
MAIIWAVLAVLALKVVTGRNTGLASICLGCAAVASLLGVALQYGVL